MDLPGYGYASLSKKEREALSVMIESYLNGRSNLMNVYLLVDCRHDPLDIDLEFMEWLAGNGLPFTIVFTKADKLNRQERNRSLARYRKALESTWEELPPFIMTSAEAGEGKKELLLEMKEIRNRF